MRPKALPSDGPRALGPASVRGVALVLVLWVLALLTVMALSMTASQRTELALTDTLVADARFRAAADAAIAYTALSFLIPRPAAEAGLGSSGAQGAGGGVADGTEPEWLPNGAPRDWAFAGEAMTITVTNERSRIDLNQAQSETLAALMAVVGVDEDAARALGDAIVDFRDPDDLKLLNGAEADDYKAAGRPIGPKNAPFSSVEELQQVLGMTRELYLRLAPDLTVDAETAQPDLQFASPEVTAAVQGIGLDAARTQVLERDAPVLPGGQVRRASGRGGPLYRVRVEERDPGGGGSHRTMEVLLELTPGQQVPYRIRWRRYGVDSGRPFAPGSDT